MAVDPAGPSAGRTIPPAGSPAGGATVQGSTPGTQAERTTQPGGGQDTRDTFERGAPVSPLFGNAPSVGAAGATTAPAAAGPASEIRQGALRAGLNESEARRIEGQLAAMPEASRAREAGFLRTHVLASPRAAEALRTYSDLLDREQRDPLRMNRELTHTLTRSVADPVPGAAPESGGVMTRQQALNAADALSRMPQTAYERVEGWLSGAGGPRRDGQLGRSMILRDFSGSPFTYSERGFADTARLTDLIRGRPPEELGRLIGRPSELSFLREHVLTSPNATRSLATYRRLVDLQRANPDRLTDGVVQALTRGVADRRLPGRMGEEGIMGHDQALRAAERLVAMPRDEYNQVVSLLNRAGRGDSTDVPRGADPQAERALILESLAAGRSLADVNRYADEIRGMQRTDLVRRSTGLDIDWDPRAGALQQRWTDSCGPTVIQMARAEADPIAAWDLHRDRVHDLRHPEDTIGREQRSILEAHGGTAVARVPDTGEDGSGMALPDALATHATPHTGRTYEAREVPNTAAAREAELERITPLLRQGVDVPIRVQWPDGGGHFMMISDVQGGPGAEGRFLVSDPWTGRTAWINGQDIARGNTDFMAGHGRLTHTYR